MNGLQKRCVALSAALHGGLILLFFIGSGFVQRRDQAKTVAVEMLTFIPDRLIEGDAKGGGSPDAPRDAKVLDEPLPAVIPPPQAQARPIQQQPQALPPTPPPEVKKETPPPRVKQPDPPPKPEAKKAKEPKAEEPKAKEPEKDPTLPADKVVQKPAPKHKVDVNLNPTARSNAKQKEELARAREKAEAAEAAEAAARAREAREAAAAAQKQRVMGALSGLQGKLSKGGVSAVPFGPGGPTYANYDQYVVSLYDRAWRVPDDVSDSGATVKAKIVIARDGRILSAQIMPPRSGNAAFDKSVQAALNRIESIGRSFPETVKDDQRTIYINFNLQAKRASG